VFTRSAKAPNILSQKLTGLERGKYYFLSALTLDMDDVKNPGSVNRRSAFGVKLEGAEIVPGLKWANVFPPSLGPDRRRYRGKPIAAHATYRLVFKATGETAEVSFSDWAGESAPGGKIGGETILAYVICRPYYVEGEEELNELATRWPVNNQGAKNEKSRRFPSGGLLRRRCQFCSCRGRIGRSCRSGGRDAYGYGERRISNDYGKRNA
jgi:hypothetical protein